MKKHVAGLVCGAVGLVLYLNTLKCGFCYDDKSAVLENADLLSGAPWANLLLNDFWGKPLHLNTSHKSYRPLCVASFKMNYMLHGLDPMGYHLVNVILHAVVCYLYVQLCAVVFNTTTIWPALVAGLLFATHPIHTEAVAGVVGRADLMCAIFYLLALLLYHYHCNPWQHGNEQSPTQKEYSCVGGGGREGGGSAVTLCMCMMCVVCAMLCKEHGLTALGVCLAQDFLIYQQNALPVLISRVRYKLFLPPDVKFFLRRATILMAVAAVLLLARVQLMMSAPKFSELDNEALALSSPHRQLHWAYLVVVNIRLLLFPSPLLHDYRMNAIPLLCSLWDPRHLLTLIAMIGLFLLCVSVLSRHIRTWNIKHMTLCTDNMRSGQHTDKGQSLSGHMMEHATKAVKPVLITGILLLIIPFLPAANIFFPVGFVVAERILYLPSMGFSLLVAYSLHRMTKSKHKLFTFSVRVLLLLLLVTHSTKTVLRNRDWKSQLNLYTSVLHKYPTNGHILANVARELRTLHDYKRAEAVYRHSIHVAPDVLDSYINLGSMLQAHNRFRASEEILCGALPLMLRRSHDRGKLAAIYTTLCNMIATNSSRLEEATEFCMKAVQTDQHLFTAHNSLGAVLLKRGESRSAIQSFKKAATLNKTSTTADYNLALVYASLGEDMLALQTLEKVLSVETSHDLARKQLEQIRKRYYGQA